MPTPVNMHGFSCFSLLFPYTLQNEGNWGRSSFSSLCCVYFSHCILPGASDCCSFRLQGPSWPFMMTFCFGWLAFRTSATALPSCLLWGQVSIFAKQNIFLSCQVWKLSSSVALLIAVFHWSGSKGPGKKAGPNQSEVVKIVDKTFSIPSASRMEIWRQSGSRKAALTSKDNRVWRTNSTLIGDWKH